MAHLGRRRVDYVEWIPYEEWTAMAESKPREGMLEAGRRLPEAVGIRKRRGGE